MNAPESNPRARRWRTPLLVGAALLLALVLGLSLLGRNATAPPRGAPAGETAGSGSGQQPTPETVLHLRTESRPGGYVAVIDADTGKVLRELDPTGDGFMRTVLRILPMDREQESDTPLRLVRWSDGTLTLEDPVTGTRYEDLQAFGSTNADAFEGLFKAARGS
ncbi:putative photosynthetic complex assembly protein [Ectothiorhodospira mobilis]|uniref:Putative photosynthetic complex assembly protein n=1 Tax=Ectothiorhodospira mobilis TaxID=195064 RepID=A0A1I4PM70_ECTMO|nr:photosynthetic complex assembly protein PuhC [Ectothiorhodospira mobilis]SFM28838.1 putative photosynthetic complex assembly protein [Ectothiorhodospira mobilis]